MKRNCESKINRMNILDAQKILNAIKNINMNIKVFIILTFLTIISRKLSKPN